MASSILCSVAKLLTKILSSIPSSLPPSSSTKSMKPSSSLLLLPSTQSFLSFGLVEELKRLCDKVERIRTTLKDAEEKEVREESVKLWLSELRQVAYDAENILGDFEYEMLRYKLEASLYVGNRKRKHEVIDSIRCDPLNDPTFAQEMFVRMRHVNEMLDEIERERIAFGLIEEDGEMRLEYNMRVPTSSQLDQTRIHGRNDDRDKIVDALLSDGELSLNGSIPVVSIVAMGGMGKTTLAKLVYDDHRIMNHFNLRSWVWVSEVYDLSRVVREIIESVTGQQYDLVGLDQLQHILKMVLTGRKFLLILDDVWNEDPVEWEKLRSALNCSAKGSRVVITTRNEKVSMVMSTALAFSLKPLLEGDSWALFCQHAFDGHDTSNVRQSLAAIGKQIVEKSRGVPLAVKTLGSLLCYETSEEIWYDVLRSDLWNLQEGEDHILSSLRLSYQYLPGPLKPCFTYLAAFPKGCYLQKDTMVQMWAAQGFIQTDDTSQAEEAGRSYFDALCGRSLLQSSVRNMFMIHDLIHDLGRSILGEEYFVTDYIESQGITCSKTVRHLAITFHSQGLASFNSSSDSSALRSLLLGSRYGLPHDVMRDIFHKLNLQYLKVLDLSYTGLGELPLSIGNLKHLHFLGLAGVGIKLLPESVCNLYNLRTLDLRDCHQLVELPQGTKDLISLHHLDILKTVLLDLSKWYLTSGIGTVPMPVGIGRLTRLLTLPEFVVSRDDKYARISELKDLNDLAGLLCIVNLHNLSGRKDEAKEANLSSKSRLGKLYLHWNKGKTADSVQANEMEDFDVLESLQPHRSITEVKIVGYGASRFPKWVSNPFLSNLETVEISHCANCSYLPHFGRLPSLRRLELKHLKGLLEWGEKLSGGTEDRGCYHCLNELLISNCTSMVFLSLHKLMVLEKFQIINCKALSAIEGLGSGVSPDGQQNNHLPSLKTLMFQSCSKLAFSEEDRLPRTLEFMRVVKCPLLQDWSQRHHDELSNVTVTFLSENQKSSYREACQSIY